MLDASSYVAFGGGASATLDSTAPSIDVFFDGFVESCVMPSATDLPVAGFAYACPDARAISHVRCQSSRHRLTLTRR
jgi:hypothetical protein